MADISTPRPWGAYERDSDPPANWSIRGADGMRVATHLYKKDALDIVKAIESHARLLRVEKLARELGILVENVDICDLDVLKAKARELKAEIGKGVA